MPPMSRPLMTACAKVSSIGRYGVLSFRQRRAGVLFRKYAGEIAVLPLHADGVAVDVLAVGAKLHLAPGTHRGIARRDIERRERIAHLLRIGRGGALERIGKHEGLRYETAGIFEQELAVSLPI